MLCSQSAIRRIILTSAVAVSLSLGMGYGPQETSTPRKSSSGSSRPFPQQQVFKGCIKPSTFTQVQLNDDVWNYYQIWKKDYYRRLEWDWNLGIIEGLATGESPEGWPIGARIVSASEHTGYGMIVFVMMAGKDPEAKTCFDSLVRTYLKHPCPENPALMSWCIGDRAGLPRTSNATDGDFDIAYALSLADLQWGGCPQGSSTTYVTLAKRMVEALVSQSPRGGVINTKTNFILLGNWCQSELDMRDPDGDEPVRGYFKPLLSTRPSDWTLDHFPVFKRLVPSFPEAALRNKVYEIATNPLIFDAKTGLPPDFIITGRGAGEKAFRLRPAWKLFMGEPFETGEFHENAARVPWRFACDWAHSGDRRSLERAEKIATWISSVIGTDWSKVVNGYYRGTGEPLSGTGAGDRAQHFVAPMVASCSVSSRFQAQLDAGWTYLRTRHVGAKQWSEDGYYKDSLTLLALLQVSGNWWIPSVP